MITMSKVEQERKDGLSKAMDEYRFTLLWLNEFEELLEKENSILYKLNTVLLGLITIDVGIVIARFIGLISLDVAINMALYVLYAMLSMTIVVLVILLVMDWRFENKLKLRKREDIRW